MTTRKREELTSVSRLPGYQTCEDSCEWRSCYRNEDTGERNSVLHGGQFVSENAPFRTRQMSIWQQRILHQTDGALGCVHGKKKHAFWRYLWKRGHCAQTIHDLHAMTKVPHVEVYKWWDEYSNTRQANTHYDSSSGCSRVTVHEKASKKPRRNQMPYRHPRKKKACTKNRASEDGLGSSASGVLLEVKLEKLMFNDLEGPL